MDIDKSEQAVAAARQMASLVERASKGDHKAFDTLTEFYGWMQEGDTNAPIAAPRPLSDHSDPTGSYEYSRAFDAYLNCYRRGSNGYLDPHELRTLTIASDPDGGYTVPADRRNELIRQLPALSPLLALVRRPTTDRDIVSWIRVLPHGTSADIYTSAFVGGMVGEITGGGDAQPEFGTLQIPIRKARATCRFSMDLAADSEVDMSTFLMTDGAKNLALVREQQILAGSGVGNNCLGVLNDLDIATVDVQGTTPDTISNSTADMGSATKLMNLLYAIPAQYRRDSSFAFVMHPQTELAIRKLVNADGDFIWVPGMSGTPNTILGVPVIHSEFMPQQGVDGAKVILAGPLSEIVSPDRITLSAQVLVERYADTDELAIILRSRFGVGIANPRAFRFGIV